jgi:hypothetical protein
VIDGDVWVGTTVPIAKNCGSNSSIGIAMLLMVKKQTAGRRPAAVRDDYIMVKAAVSHATCHGTREQVLHSTKAGPTVVPKRLIATRIIKVMNQKGSRTMGKLWVLNTMGFQGP